MRAGAGSSDLRQRAKVGQQAAGLIFNGGSAGGAGAQVLRRLCVQLERITHDGDAVDIGRLVQGDVAVEHVVQHIPRVALERVAVAAAGSAKVDQRFALTN